MAEADGAPPGALHVGIVRVRQQREFAYLQPALAAAIASGVPVGMAHGGAFVMRDSIEGAIDAHHRLQPRAA